MAGTLDRLRDHLDALAEALGDQDWEGGLPAPVDLTAAAPLQPSELAEAQALLGRMGALKEALHGRMAAASAETQAMAPRRSAARSYLQHASENIAP